MTIVTNNNAESI